jgi:hypothetical protein
MSTQREAVQREANYQPVLKVFLHTIVEAKSLSAEQRIELLDCFNKVRKELSEEVTSQSPSATPWENVDASDYFQEYIVPAFIHEFGRTKSAAYSYIWSSDGTAVLFDANDSTLFLHHTFLDAEFRELLKTALEKEPDWRSKEAQMRLEFHVDSEEVGIGKSSYSSNILVKILHIFRADQINLYPVPDKSGDEIDRPLAISDSRGHFVIIAPVVTQEEEDKQALQDEDEQDVPSNSEDPHHAEEATTNEDSILERHRKILELREQGKSFRQIADELNMPKSSAAAEVSKHNSSTCLCAQKS